VFVGPYLELVVLWRREIGGEGDGSFKRAVMISPKIMRLPSLEGYRIIFLPL
jgi:hypothetical protein